MSNQHPQKLGSLDPKVTKRKHVDLQRKDSRVESG